MIFIHAYFNLLRVVYSLFTRKDLKFILIEIGTCLTLILLAFLISDKLGVFLEQQFSNSETKLADLIFASFFSLLFMLLSFASRWFTYIKSNNVEKKDKKGEKDKKNKKWKKPFSIGIIDFCWILGQGVAYGGVIFCQSYEVIIGEVEAGRNDAFYNLMFEEVSFLLGKCFEVLIFGFTILAACMGIIWAGEIWRKDDHKGYAWTTSASKKMTFAYFGIAVAIIVWVAIPLYSKMTVVKYFIPAS